MFPGENADIDTNQMSDFRKSRHARWFEIAFDKHKEHINGKNWNIFYSEYLIPKHDRELLDIRLEKDDQIKDIV